MKSAPLKPSIRSLPALPKSLSRPWSPSMLSLPWPPMIQSARSPPVAVSSPSPSQAMSRPRPSVTVSLPARERTKSEPPPALIVSAAAVPLILSLWSVPLSSAATAMPANKVVLAPMATSDDVSLERLMLPSTTVERMSCGVSTLSALLRLAALTILVVAIAAASVAPDALPESHQRAGRPNIVFVLTDDLSWNLVQYMPHVQQMQREGMTFSNYFVTDSLCCPSRASIFSGRYPQNHGVLTNTPPTGGFSAFRRGAESETFATALQGSGYRTSLMGKYLNGYDPKGGYVAPGWSNWQASGGGYRGFNYALSTNGRIAHFGRSRRAYLTDVLRRRGKAFVSRAARSGHPFLLEVATFAPHRPSTPAPRDRHDFPGLQVPRDSAFDAVPDNAPAWLRGRAPLTEEQVAAMDTEFRKRAQSVQAVDDLVGQVRRLLRGRGLDRNTYVIFSSDNGYHMGQRRLLAGKMTAYDSDIRVPLIVVGPGVPAGSTTDALAENVDLAPTFMRLAGVSPPVWVDGQGLLSLFDGRVPRPWRDAVLIEHHHPETPNGDPDRQTASSGNPPSYEALRTTSELYVEYVDGEREWYDLRSDPDELNNRYGELQPDEQAALHSRLVALEACRGASCRRASTP